LKTTSRAAAAACRSPSAARCTTSSPQLPGAGRQVPGAPAGEFFTGLAAGEPPTLARRYARLIQADELGFWNTLADPIPEPA
jgi:hypothetical protein